MIVYVSGKYTDKTKEKISQNIKQARRVAVELWDNGITTICPHLNTAHFEKDCKAGYKDYIKGDLEILSKCNAIIMLPNWVNSKGAKIELEFALLKNIKVYFWKTNNDILINELKNE